MICLYVLTNQEWRALRSQQAGTRHVYKPPKKTEEMRRREEEERVRNEKEEKKREKQKWDAMIDRMMRNLIREKSGQASEEADMKVGRLGHATCYLRMCMCIEHRVNDPSIILLRTSDFNHSRVCAAGTRDLYLAVAV